jgi:Protein of unknown function (DUF2798)
MPPPLPARAQRFVLPLVLTGMMVLIVTGFTTVIIGGVNGATLGHWLRAYVVTWPIAYASMLVVLPLAQRVTAQLVRR